LILLAFGGFGLLFALGTVGAGALGWLAWVNNELSKRITALEKCVATLTAAPAVAPLPPAEEPTEEVTEEVATREAATEAPAEEPPAIGAPSEPGAPEPAVEAPAAPPKPPFTLPSLEKLVVWLAAALGGTTLVLAGLLGLAVVIERGWLGPSVRVCLGLGAGTVLWLGGVAIRRRLPVLGAALSGVAIGVLYGTLFAAHGLYHLLPGGAVFGAMVAVTAVATATAARDGDRFTAHLALIGGLLTPVLVSSGENRPIALFGYLALLLGGVLWAARRRGWWDVTAVAALGAMAIHAGWSIRWYAADQAPVALVAAIVLAVPFAAVATSERTSLRVAGFLASLAIPLLALPWVVPVDPVFHDPRSGLTLVRPLAAAAWWAVLAVALLPVHAWLASRRHAQPIGSAAASLVAGLLVLTGGIGWLAVIEPRPGAVALIAVGALATGALALAARRAAAGLLPLPLASGFVLAVLGGVHPEHVGPALGLGVAALVLLGALAARAPRSALTLPATLLGVAMALGVAAGQLTGHARPWVLGPTLVALAVFGLLPLVVSWRDLRRVAWVTAALAWPALFPALHLLWTHAWGWTVIGVLPALLGTGALMGAVALVRIHRVDRSSLALALLVAVALMGATTAIALQLHEGWLTVALSVEALALGLLARRLSHPLLRWSSLLLGVAVGVRLLLNPSALAYGDTSGWPILNWTLYTWGVPFLALLALARWFPRRDTWLDHAHVLVRILALLVGFALVEVEVAHSFEHAGPVELGGHGLWQGMVRSMAWAGYGLLVLIVGLWNDRREVRFLGFSFVLLATAKVFAVDLWSLSGFVRVASVGALGVSLLVAAFLFERLVLRTHAREAPS